jgi:alpha/beta superfamily hydrolase
MIPERPAAIASGAGITLEGALAQPAGAAAGLVVCHPHPRHGGDMDSPVVALATESCGHRGLATLRFNFRGVGRSQGAWDEGRGEQDDVRAALAYLRGALGSMARVALAGYSFGASMAAAVVAGGELPAGLALIAPPVSFPAWQRPGALPIEGPLLIVAGSEDTYCPLEALAALARARPTATVTVIDGADHFFYSGHDELAAALDDWAVKLLGEVAGMGPPPRGPHR